MIKKAISLIITLLFFSSSLTPIYAGTTSSNIKFISSNEITELFKPGINAGKKCKELDDSLKNIIEFSDTIYSTNQRTKDLTTGIVSSIGGDSLDANSQSIGVIIDLTAKLTDDYLTSVNADELTKDFFSQYFDTLKLYDQKDIASKLKVIANVIRNSISIGCNSNANYNMYKARKSIYENIKSQMFSEKFISELLLSDYLSEKRKASNSALNLIVINACKINLGTNKDTTIKYYTENIDLYTTGKTSLSQRRNYFISMLNNNNYFDITSEDKFNKNFNVLEDIILKTKDKDRKSILETVKKYSSGSNGCTKNYREYAMKDIFPHSYEYKKGNDLYISEYNSTAKKNPKLKSKDINKLIVKNTKNDNVRQIARGYVSGK